MLFVFNNESDMKVPKTMQKGKKKKNQRYWLWGRRQSTTYFYGDLIGVIKIIIKQVDKFFLGQNQQVS